MDVKAPRSETARDAATMPVLYWQTNSCGEAMGGLCTPILAKAFLQLQNLLKSHNFQALAGLRSALLFRSNRTTASSSGSREGRLHHPSSCGVVVPKDAWVVQEGELLRLAAFRAVIRKGRSKGA